MRNRTLEQVLRDSRDPVARAALADLLEETGRPAEARLTRIMDRAMTVRARITVRTVRHAVCRRAIVYTAEDPVTGTSLIVVRHYSTRSQICPTCRVRGPGYYTPDGRELRARQYQTRRGGVPHAEAIVFDWARRIGVAELGLTPADDEFHL